ncbi:MAG: toxin-antitoxin system HicB family antitoxin [Boseongicola sp.]|nr:toxin-antitoxin system HicB family antitoxin [Boseongicola sp.]
MLHGRLEFIPDLVTYEGADARTTKAACQDAVDDCIALCKAWGRVPDMPLKDSFNVRPGRDLHRRAALFAGSRGTNLNTAVSDALQSRLDRERGLQASGGNGQLEARPVRRRNPTPPVGICDGCMKASRALRGWFASCLAETFPITFDISTTGRAVGVGTGFSATARPFGG